MTVDERISTLKNVLSVSVESIPYREAGNNQLLRHIPGPADYGAVTLRYGVTTSRELWDWMMVTARGEVDRRNVSIILLDSTGSSEVMRWNLQDAWPSEWQGASLVASDRAIAIDPAGAPVWFNRGNALLALGRAAEAVESYDRALSLDPLFALAGKNRKMAYENMEKKS